LITFTIVLTLLLLLVLTLVRSAIRLDRWRSFWSERNVIEYEDAVVIAGF
jgi:hypothetical protein